MKEQVGKVQFEEPECAGQFIEHGGHSLQLGLVIGRAWHCCRLMVGPERTKEK
jgi:hypothetical protein